MKREDFREIYNALGNAINLAHNEIASKKSWRHFNDDLWEANIEKVKESISEFKIAFEKKSTPVNELSAKLNACMQDIMEQLRIAHRGRDINQKKMPYFIDAVRCFIKFCIIDNYKLTVDSAERIREVNAHLPVLMRDKRSAQHAMDVYVTESPSEIHSFLT